MIPKFYPLARNPLFFFKSLPIVLGIFFLVLANPAKAFIPGDYNFAVSNAAYNPIAGTQMIGGSNVAPFFNDGVVAGPTNIGFSFQFDCLACLQRKQQLGRLFGR